MKSPVEKGTSVFDNPKRSKVNNFFSFFTVPSMGVAFWSSNRENFFAKPLPAANPRKFCPAKNLRRTVLCRRITRLNFNSTQFQLLNFNHDSLPDNKALMIFDLLGLSKTVITFFHWARSFVCCAFVQFGLCYFWHIEVHRSVLNMFCCSTV